MRSDAIRNREEVLEAAGRLYDAAQDPATVTAAAIAIEAGVGKGTVFRGFGSLPQLVLALFQRRSDLLFERISSIDTALPPVDRALLVMSSVLEFKRNNGVLAAAVEASDGNPYNQAVYARWHLLLEGLIVEARGHDSADFLAHALLAATRSELLGHLSPWPDARIWEGIHTLTLSIFAPQAPMTE